MSALIAKTVSKVFARWGRRNLGSEAAGQIGGVMDIAFDAAFKEAGVDDPEAALAQVFGLDPGDADADQLADFIEASLPAKLRAMDKTIDPDDQERQPPPRPPPPDEHIDEERIRAAGDAWSALEPAYEMFEEIESDLSSESRWTIEAVASHLAFMFVSSKSQQQDDPNRRNNYPHRDRFETSVDQELSIDMPRRYATALIIEESFREWERPGFEMGRDVHWALQERYVRHRHPPNDVVQEAYVYTWGKKRRTIAEAVRDEGRNINTDCIYLVLDFARLTKKPPIDNIKPKERWDNVDLDLGEFWEIKPAQYLSQAVLQESYYRNKINFTILPFRDARKFVSSEFFMPGGADYPSYDFFPGDVLIVTKRGRVAYPFTVASLPGIVGYIVLGDERDMERVRQRLRQFLRALARALKAVVEIIIMAIIVIITIVILVSVLLVLLILLGLINPSPAPQPGQPALPPGGGGDKVPPIKNPIEAPVGAISLRARHDRRGAGVAIDVLGIEDPDATTLDLTAVRVHNLPPAAIGALLGRLKPALNAFLTALNATPESQWPSGGVS